MISAFTFLGVHLSPLQCTLMQTGQDVQILAAPPPGMPCSLVTTSFHGRPSVKRQYPVRVPKPSIEQWQMVSPRLVGCVSCLVSFAVLSAEPPSSIVTTSVLFISPPIQSSTSVQNMLRLIFTSFVSVSLFEKFVCCTSQPLRSMQTSSPRDFRHQCSQSLGPVLIYAVLLV